MDDLKPILRNNTALHMKRSFKSRNGIKSNINYMNSQPM